MHATREAKAERGRNLDAVSKRCAATRKRTTKLCQADRDELRAREQRRELRIRLQGGLFDPDVLDRVRERRHDEVVVAERPRRGNRDGIAALAQLQETDAAGAVQRLARRVQPAA